MMQGAEPFTYCGRADLQAVLDFGTSVVAARPRFSGGWHPGEFAWSLAFEPNTTTTLFRQDGVLIAVASLDGDDLWVEAPGGNPLWETALGWSLARTGSSPRVRVFEGDLAREESLHALGYRPDAHEGVLFEYDLQGDVPEAICEEGFRVCDCQAVPIRARIDAHLEAWNALGHIGLPDARSSFDAEVYARVRSSPGYDPSLDLVVMAPDGRIAGTGIAWLDRTTQAAAFEPIGVAPAYRGRRLTRLMMHEALRRLRAAGAVVARVGTAHFNTSAIAAYSAAGFRLVGRSRWWRRI